MKSILKPIFIALTPIILFGLNLTAQDITIHSEDFSTCSATFNDTNPIGQYGNNENDTITVCADGDPILNFYFIGFDIGAGDMLSIYDGPDLNSPLIGEYVGTDLVNQNVTSTNASGCLTLLWASDGSGVGDFGAIINCGPPCQHPIIHGSLVGDTGNPVLLCVGENFTIDASTTEFLDGATLVSQIWNFDDGSIDVTSWPTVTHSYSEPGIYSISLVVTDNTECTNLNLLEQYVFVSTTPNITTTTTADLICTGSEAQLIAQLAATPFNNIPTGDFGDGVYIPDNQGCFTDTINVSSFQQGSTITSVDQIENLYASLEHTFLTDITIAFICPNGSVLSVYSQQGICGDIDLGYPLPADDGLPGVGIVYTWSPTTTYPTLAEGCSDPAYYFEDAGDSGVNMSEATYASEDPWTNLIGCPFNGPWIIQVCDIVGIDDGWIFEWGVTFDAASGDPLNSFIPTFGQSCDSTFWAGNYIDNSYAFCDSVLITPDVPGIQTYTYTAIDNFGCAYTEDIVVDVYQGPIPQTSGDLNFCGPEIAITGSVTNPTQGVVYNYSWSPAGPLSNPNIPNTFIEQNGIDTTTSFVFTIVPANDPNCIVHDTIVAFIPEVPAFAPLDTVSFCAGYTYDLYAPVNVPGYTYDWYFSPDNDEFVEVQSSDVYAYGANMSGYYFVEIIEPICLFSSTTPYFAYIRPCQIHIPNVFTPTNDRFNNYFEIEGLEDFPNSTIKIYNRWGNMVYENQNYKNNWDADGMADGTYYYILGVNELKGMKYFEGVVTVLRE